MRMAFSDLFVVPTISFRLLIGLLITGHCRRQILWFGVIAPDGRMVRQSAHCRHRCHFGDAVADDRLLSVGPHALQLGERSAKGDQ